MIKIIFINEIGFPSVTTLTSSTNGQAAGHSGLNLLFRCLRMRSLLVVYTCGKLYNGACRHRNFEHPEGAATMSQKEQLNARKRHVVDRGRV
jgi:hypothetical protein